MDLSVKSFPIPPNSVYVWRGFKNTAKSFEEFAGFLGNVFVPACALLQPPVGLRAYYPTLVPQENKNDVLPDQTALMFWATPQSHNLANETVAVRIYQNLHGALYDMSRSKTQEVPVLLPESRDDFIYDQPYYLFDNPADWMLGQTVHVVGSRPATQNTVNFQNAIFKWATGFKKTMGAKSDATLVCCNADYAVAWCHTPNVSIDFSSCLESFKALVDVHLDIVPRKVKFGENLWSKWNGIDYTDPQNTSLNVQLDRPTKTDPVP